MCSLLCASPHGAPRRPTILTKRGSSYDDIVRMDAKVAHFSLTFTILSGLGIVLITRWTRFEADFD